MQRLKIIVGQELDVLLKVRGQWLQQLGRERLPQMIDENKRLFAVIVRDSALTVKGAVGVGKGRDFQAPQLGDGTQNPKAFVGGA